VAAVVLLVVLALGPGAPAGSHAPHDDIFAVVVSPDVGSDGVVHTISRGFLMRSTDAGATWRRIVDGLSNRVGLVALAGHPDEADVLYAAGGEGSVFRSGDGGLGWDRVGTLPGDAAATVLVVAPMEGAAEVVYAALLDGGLLRSGDGGASWEAVLPADVLVAGVAVDATGERVRVPSHDGTLHSSDDGGRTWRDSPLPGDGHPTSVLLVPGDGDAGLLVGTSEGEVLRVDGSGDAEVGGDGLPDEAVLGLAASVDGDGQVLYGSTETSGVHRSEDGGRTWSERADGLTTDPQADEAEYVDRPDFGPVAAGDLGGGEEVVLVGGFDGLFRSTDGAGSWTEVDTIRSTTVVGLSVSPAFADDGTLLVTTYLNGAHISRDGGRTWEPSNDGLEEPGQYDDGPDRFARLYGPAISAAYPDDGTMFITRPRTLLRSTDRGRTWTALDVPGTSPSDGALNYVIVVPEPDVVVLGDARTGLVHRSEDGGRSLSTVGEVGDAVLSLAVDATDPQVLHAGTRRGVATSRDGGVTWEPPGDEEAWAATTVAAGTGPDGETLLAGTPRGLRASHDGGDTWAAADLGDASDRPVEGVVASPAFADDGTVLVSVRGEGLFRSVDGGRTFVPIAPELGPEQHIPTSYSKPTSAPIAFSPTFARDRTVVASVGSEVLVSTDGGDTWAATEIEVATHPPVEPDAAAGATRWGRRRIAAAAGAGLLLLGVVGVGVVLLTRRRRKARPGGDGSD
jgi:photosystem II stability/assembly factor-like uncharacterized protein